VLDVAELADVERGSLIQEPFSVLQEGGHVKEDDRFVALMIGPYHHCEKVVAETDRIEKAEVANPWFDFQSEVRRSCQVLSLSLERAAAISRSEPYLLVILD